MKPAIVKQEKFHSKLLREMLVSEGKMVSKKLKHIKMFFNYGLHHISSNLYVLCFSFYMCRSSVCM